MDSAALWLQQGLLWVLAPLWLLAGWLDSACHRRLHIEETAGTRESLLHLAMLAQLGLGVSVALLLQVNAAAFVLLALAALAHEATMWLDLAYANRQREVPWFEQLVHGAQQSIPWVALAALVVLHRGQALALLGWGDAQPDWHLRLKQPPLPPGYLLGFYAAALVAVVWPLLREFQRCRLADFVRQRTAAGPGRRANCAHRDGRAARRRRRAGRPAHRPARP